MRLIGIDENGYGPVLGPLVVTSTSLKLQSSSFALIPDLWRLLGIKKDPGSNSKGLLVCDSKMVFNTSRKKKLAAEETVLAFFYLCFGFLPKSADQFLKVVIDPATTTYNPSCFCWKNDLSLQLNPERRKDILKNAEKLRKRTRQKGVTLEKPRCFLLCPSLFNTGLKNRNKSGLVLEAGLNLLKSHSDKKPFLAWLGRVGGLRYYQEHISTFFGPQYTVTPNQEEKNNSAYELSKSGKAAGTITYLQDGEENSFNRPVFLFRQIYPGPVLEKNTHLFRRTAFPPSPFPSPHRGEAR